MTKRNRVLGLTSSRLRTWDRVNRVDVAVLGLAVVAVLLVVLRTWNFGIGTSPDSAQYLSMARNLVFGDDAFVGPHMRTSWPPLFTFVLSIACLEGGDPLDTVAILNPLVLGMICLVSGLWLHRRTESAFFCLAVMTVVAFSIPLTRVASFVWTEPLFVLLTMLSLIYTEKVLRGDAPHCLYLAALFAALACLTRYAGVVLVGTTTLMLLWRPQLVLGERVRQMLVYLAVAMVPLCAWLVRNYLLYGSLAGYRVPSDWSLIDNTRRLVETLGKWAIPLGSEAQGFGLALAALPFVGVVVVTFASAYVLVRRLGVCRASSLPELSDPFVRVLGCYAVAYLGFIVVVSTMVRFDRIDYRLIVPVFVPIALVGGFAVARLGSALKKRYVDRLHYKALVGAVFLFAASSLAAFVPELRTAMCEGHGYASKDWRDSETIAWIRASGTSRALSNVGSALYVLAPSVSAEWLPRDASRLPMALGSVGQDRIVWFHRTSFEYDLPSMATELGLHLEKEFEDAVVFKVSGPAFDPGHLEAANEHHAEDGTRTARDTGELPRG